MPPKRISSSIQTNKRTLNSDLPGLAKRQKTAEDTSPNVISTLQKMDTHCWICHYPCQCSGIDLECQGCQRVYHRSCLDQESLKFKRDRCQECQLRFHNRAKDGQFLTVEMLSILLSYAANEFRNKFVKQKEAEKKAKFFHWSFGSEIEVVHGMDFDTIEENIKDQKYISISEVKSEVKWIHHNFCQVRGVSDNLTKEAYIFVNMFAKELSEMEDCPECFYRMFVIKRTEDFFIKICRKPHDIVWAWMKGSPAWPAKCLRVVNGKAHVVFFGTHDKAKIILGNKTCFAISEIHPIHKQTSLKDLDNLHPKTKGFRLAVEELVHYTKAYKRKLKKSVVYYEPGTPYKSELAPKPIRKRGSRNRRSNISTFSTSDVNVSTVSNADENQEESS